MKKVVFVFVLSMFFLLYGAQNISAHESTVSPDLYYESYTYNELVFEEETLVEQNTLDQFAYSQKIDNEVLELLGSENTYSSLNDMVCPMSFEGCVTGPITYVIQFDSQGGTYVSPIFSRGGLQINQPSAPTKNNLEFLGWYRDLDFQQPFHFNTMPTENFTLYAKWSSRDKIVNIDQPIGVVDCEDVTITHCDVTVTRTTAYTTLKTQVNFNPHSKTDGFMKTELTWDILPHFRFEDYISLIYDGTKIVPFDHTLKGIVEYDYIFRDASGLEEHILGVKEEYTLSDSPDLFLGFAQGHIFTASLPSDIHMEGIHYKEVTALKISLEKQFVVNGNVNFNELGLLRIAADYRHKIIKLSFTWDFGFQLSLEGINAGISVNLSITHELDGSRYSSITINV